jgi:hypothetical protein
MYFQGESQLSWALELLSRKELPECIDAQLDLYLRDWRARKASKYEQVEGPVDWPTNKRKLFVPLQTPRDATMWYPRTTVNHPKALVSAVLDAIGDDWYPIFKKHPGDPTPSSAYRIESDKHYTIAETGNIHDLIEESDATVLINSTVGIEALALGRRVVTLGDAFYSKRGWTETVHDLTKLPEAIEMISAQPTVVGQAWLDLRQFLHWIIFRYLVDPQLEIEDLEARYEVAQCYARRVQCDLK